MSSSTEEVRTLRRLVEELEAYTTELKGQVVRLEEQLIVLRRVRSPRRVARDNARLDQVEAAVLHQRIASLLDENIALSSSNAALVEHARKCPNCGALHNVRARTAIAVTVCRRREWPGASVLAEKSWRKGLKRFATSDVHLSGKIYFSFSAAAHKGYGEGPAARDRRLDLRVSAPCRSR